MQFYIVDGNPDVSASLLPDYALKRVNIREGWQIISDIGHRFGFKFPCQNKCYNAFHPLTRQFSNQKDFLKLFYNYNACCLEYKRRFRKTTVHIDLFISNFFFLLCKSEAFPRDQFEEVRHYLKTRKGKHLTEIEKERL